MGALEDELEDINQAIQSLEQALESTILEAEEDGDVTPEEKDRIKLATGLVKDAKLYRDEVAAEIAKSGKGGAEGDPGGKLGEDPDSGSDDSAKSAWKAFAKPYRKLLGLYADLKDDGESAADDLREYLDAIQVALSEENWTEALNQGVLAMMWADDEGLFEEYPPEEDDDEDDSGKEAWDKAIEPGTLEDFRSLQADLKDMGNEHAGKIADFLAKIDAAVDDENWSLALQQLVLCAKFSEDNKLWDLVEDDDFDDEDEDEEDDDVEDEDDDVEDDDDDVVVDENPEKTAWETTKKHLYPMIRDLYAKMLKADHPLANRIGADLDEIDEAERDEEWVNALTLLIKAGKFADDNDLWNEVDPKGGGGVIAADHKKKLDKIKSLHRDLLFEEHPMAKELGDLIDKVPEKVTSAMDLIPADRALQRAYEFADKNKLWDVRRGLPKSEEEELFWEHHGENYRKVKSLHRRLVDLKHEEAGEIGKILESVDKNIKEQTFFAATMGIDRAIEYADDYKLWDDTPIETWQGLQKDVEKLRELHEALKEARHKEAKTIGEFISRMDKAADKSDWEDAERQYAAGKALADALKLWDIIESDEDEKEEVDPLQAAWEARRAEYDEIVALHDRLISEMHPQAAEIGSLLTTITDAVDAGKWEDAGKFLDAAIKIAKDNKLWTLSDEKRRIDPSTAKISGSVGKGGKNKSADVETVQLLLNQNGANPELEPDGDCGKLTIGAIEKFQKSKLGWKDGRVDPGGKTWAALTGGDVIEKVVDVVEDAADKISDTAGKAVDKAKDIVEDIGEFFDDLFDDDDDKKGKSS